MNEFSSIIGKISGAERVVLLPHVHADGDSLGSCAALCLYLKKTGREAVIAAEEPAEKNLEYITEMPGVDFRLADETDDENLFGGKPYLAIAVDMSDAKRLASREKIFYRAESTARIDHHETAEDFSDATVCDTKWAATAEGICGLFCAIGYMPWENAEKCDETDKNIAVCLYTALVTDTGCFAYSNVTADTHMCGAACLAVAGDLSWIYRRVFETKTKACIAIKKIAYGKIFYPYDYISCLEITDEDKKEAGATDEECSGLAAELRAIEGVHAAVFIRPGKIPGEKRVSMRSDETCNVARVAMGFGGGGHARAAGISKTFADEESYGSFLKALFDAIRAEVESFQG